MKRVKLFAMSVGLVALAGFCPIPMVAAEDGQNARQVVDAMLTQERAAELHRNKYAYLSQERSDRTGGHLWTERVVETSAGKMRMLIAEDGQPLSGDRAAAERARLQGIAEHPDAFEKSSAALKNDERHAKEMLDLLPKAFLFENMRQEGEFVKIDFRPNPAYVTQSMEERVLHGMSGSLLVDQRVMRLRGIEGRLPEDVSIGFGLVATIKAGSNFDTTRERVYGTEWKTQTLDTDINGRAIFFKMIGRKEHAVHSDFKVVPDGISVADAVSMLEK
ncbi:MAG TPA: hypothetical protein VK578_24800 [Edaphobacter sp.]|nr:hypothetical protein [Edaphobacter sp.]